MARMINLDAVIKHFGKHAIASYREYDMQVDDKAISALNDRSNRQRKLVVKDWLRRYQVLQGFTDFERDAVASAVVKWADQRDLQRDLSTPDALCAAHEELSEKCVRAFGRDRDFTSLASKALWLCYPDRVPIIDKNAERALFVLSKLEGDIPIVANGATRYRRFVCVWRDLYDYYSENLETIDMGFCRYQVRIFDAILLRLGEPGYGFVVDEKSATKY